MKEKCCGNCCWFCYEQTDGWGQCMAGDFIETMNCSDECVYSDEPNNKFISREEMRHHQAVLLQVKRFYENMALYKLPNLKDLIDAVIFSFHYLKVFSRL